MSKRKRYSPECKRELVELVRRSQSSCRQIALEVGINSNTLTSWLREADAGGGQGLPRRRHATRRDEEMARLKRELSKVTRERDFSRDSAAYRPASRFHPAGPEVPWSYRFFHNLRRFRGAQKVADFTCDESKSS